ncbi:MAG: sensor histidine kinase, partial [Anaerolineae bacterium]
MSSPLDVRSRGAAGLRSRLQDLPGSVGALRWILPLVIFLFVLAFEVFQNAVSGSLGSRSLFTPDLLIYGLVGPIVIWWTLTWIADSLVHREQVDAQIRELNRQLEAEVEARTRELVRANEELREADQLKSDFMSMISHELRAPLTNIQGALEILIPPESEPDPGTTGEMLGIVDEQSQRLADLVEDVLRISRIQAGGLVLRPTRFEIEPVLSRLKERFENETESHLFRVRVDNEAASVRADRDRVEEILSYL